MTGTNFSKDKPRPAVVTKFLVTLSDEITNMLGLAGPVRIGRAITQVVQARGLLKDK